MSELLIALGIPAIMLLLLGMLLWRYVGKLRQRLGASAAETADLQRQLELVRQSISGLTAGAVGMDRRVHQLEQRERALSERQENYEIQQADEQPYGRAIRLVQQGAAAGRLVSELGISESEAELIVRLHGHRDSA